ncbi:FAD-dependent monooxygenase [Embleya sp. NBC_00896]|uniref:FAD-dependent monooxygenase n=1 Tax=Embleya sp. NBC_00896 TaxID=2975961 RepID=UPI00386B7855|nr:FAD-dependent monooxygenase [Embleya sp. NBC_00896]
MPQAIVVVGAGPVGQTAALLLARWGVPVTVLDRRPARDPVGSKAICQQRDVLDVWASVGASAIADEGLTWTTARTYLGERELFAWTFAEDGDSPLPPFVNISQSRTEEILDGRIAASDLVDVRWGHEVTGVVQDADGVTLTCANGAVLRAPYVVCCTGSRGGGLREALGLDFPGRTFDDQFLICDIRAELPGWESERRFYFDPAWNPGRQVLIHPCPDSVFRIDWQVPPDFDLATEEASGGLDRRIRQIVGDRPYEIVWRSVYRFHSRMVDRMRVGRVLLAGDSAHVVAPFGARGLNSGVGDAENAAWKLAFVSRGWADEAVLETYHGERHAAAAENLDITGATMRFLVPQDETEQAVRAATLLAAAGDPELAARTVDSGRLAEPFWYVDSPLTTPAPHRPFGGRPAKGQLCVPAPGVIVPDVRVRVPGHDEPVRLREVVREGFTLLLATAGGPVDPAAAPSTDHDDAWAESLAAAARAASTAPVTVLRLDGHGAEADPARPRDLPAVPGEAWLIRPDAHIAAILPDARAGDVTVAVRRALARTGG